MRYRRGFHPAADTRLGQARTAAGHRHGRWSGHAEAREKVQGLLAGFCCHDLRRCFAQRRVWRLDVVVELEFVWVGAEPELVEFGGALVIQPGGDEVVGKDAAVREEGVVGGQGVQGGV